MKIPDGYYWIKSKHDGKWTVVQVYSLFGARGVAFPGTTGDEPLDYLVDNYSRIVGPLQPPEK